MHFSGGCLELTCLFSEKWLFRFKHVPPLFLLKRGDGLRFHPFLLLFMIVQLETTMW